MNKLIRTPLLYAVAISVFLTTVTGFVLLDAFVFSSSLASVDDKPFVCDNDNPVNKDIESTETSYSESATTVYKSISIDIFTYDQSTVYIADIQLSDARYLRSAFAKDTYGRNIRQYTSDIAENHDAILAINGDFYGYRSAGYVIRNGSYYRDAARGAPDDRALLINKDGDFELSLEGSESGQDMVARGVLQAWSFGPVLVENGAIATAEIADQNWVSASRNPRVAIAQVGPLHYLFVVVDGRSDASKGLSLTSFATLLVEHGAKTAYNLDGGGSATIWFNGKVINKPTYDGNGVYERGVSDIIYIQGNVQ